MKKKLTIYNILLAFFVLVFAISAFFLTREFIHRRQAAVYTAAIQNQYVPSIPKTPETESGSAEDTAQPESPSESLDKTNAPNPSIQQLTDEYPDAIGWLTVDGADVSHPFVQARDNATYLWTDLNREYILGGTLFMDCSNSRDFSDKLTVIYGHNMRNGTMFAQLSNYLDFDYLLKNPDIYISLPMSTEHYTIAACLVVDGSDNVVYDNIGERDDIGEVVDFIYENTSVNPDTPLDADSDILVLSTCNRTFNMARTLLICVPD